MTWRTTWQSRWTTLTPSQCQSKASRRQNVGRTCTSCSTSTPSSPIPLASWRKAPQRTAFQVGISFQQSANALFLSSFQNPALYFRLHFPLFTSHAVFPHIICTRSCCAFFPFFFLSSRQFPFFSFFTSTCSASYKPSSYILHCFLTLNFFLCLFFPPTFLFS